MSKIVKYKRKKVFIQNGFERLCETIQYAIDSDYQIRDRQYFYRLG